jgi:hypothetical protein
MKWRILRFLCALLTVLCVLLWACSYGATHFIQYGWIVPGHPDRINVVGYGGYHGQLTVRWTSLPKAFNDFVIQSTRASQFLGLRSQSYAARRPLLRRDLWFFYQSFHQGMPANADGSYAPTLSAGGAPRLLPASQYTISIPLWLPILLFGAVPTWRLIGSPARRRRNRIAAGQCVSCSYDLRATPDRCPECGAASEKLSSVLTFGQAFRRYCIGIVAAWTTSLFFALILAAFSSVLICQFLYQNMFGLHPTFLQGWAIFNRLMACIALCALGIIFSALISLFLVDTLRRWRSILSAKN